MTASTNKDMDKSIIGLQTITNNLVLEIEVMLKKCPPFLMKDLYQLITQQPAAFRSALLLE